MDLEPNEAAEAATNAGLLADLYDDEEGPENANGRRGEAAPEDKQSASAETHGHSSTDPAEESSPNAHGERWRGVF
jgi:hypothetical protein